jgi:hypothetical protein
LLLLPLLGSLCLHLPFVLLLLLLLPSLLLLLLLFLLQQVLVLFPDSLLLLLCLPAVSSHWLSKTLWWLGLALAVGWLDKLEGVGLSLPGDVGTTAQHNTAKHRWHGMACLSTETC